MRLSPVSSIILGVTKTINSLLPTSFEVERKSEPIIGRSPNIGNFTNVSISESWITPVSTKVSPFFILTAPVSNLLVFKRLTSPQFVIVWVPDIPVTIGVIANVINLFLSIPRTFAPSFIPTKSYVKLQPEPSTKVALTGTWSPTSTKPSFASLRPIEEPSPAAPPDSFNISVGLARTFVVPFWILAVSSLLTNLPKRSGPMPAFKFGDWVIMYG